MEMDLQYVGVVAGVVTQGRGDSTNHWVTRYRVSTSTDCVMYTFVQSGAEFTANTDRSTRVNVLFPSTVLARCVRVHPTAWSSGIAMRAAVLARIRTSTPSAAPANCPAGQFSVDGVKCETCQPGTFGNASGASLCFQCPPGTFSSGTAATACTACGTGYFAGQFGSVQCTACPVGKSTTESYEE